MRNQVLYIISFAAIFICQIAQAQLQHYCHDSNQVGRVQYSCMAQFDIGVGLHQMRSAYRHLKQIPYNDIRRSCVQNARTTCKDQALQNKKNRNDQGQQTNLRECVQGLRDQCIAERLENASTSAVEAFGEYDKQCSLSLNAASSCEQQEAHPYCKQNILARAREQSPPTDSGKLRRFKRAMYKFFQAYKKRKKSLRNEIRGHERKLKRDMVDELGCDGFVIRDICIGNVMAEDPDMKMPVFAENQANTMVAGGFQCDCTVAMRQLGGAASCQDEPRCNDSFSLEVPESYFPLTLKKREISCSDKCKLGVNAQAFFQDVTCENNKTYTVYTNTNQNGLLAFRDWAKGCCGYDPDIYFQCTTSTSSSTTDDDYGSTTCTQL